jgi:chromosome segregation ATPase
VASARERAAAREQVDRVNEETPDAREAPRRDDVVQTPKQRKTRQRQAYTPEQKEAIKARRAANKRMIDEAENLRREVEHCKAKIRRVIAAIDTLPEEIQTTLRGLLEESDDAVQEVD